MKLWLLVQETEASEFVLNSIWDDQPESYQTIAGIVEDCFAYRIIRGIAISIEGKKR